MIDAWSLLDFSKFRCLKKLLFDFDPYQTGIDHFKVVAAILCQIPSTSLTSLTVFCTANLHHHRAGLEVLQDWVNTLNEDQFASMHFTQAYAQITCQIVYSSQLQIYCESINDFEALDQVAYEQPPWSPPHSWYNWQLMTCYIHLVSDEGALLLISYPCTYTLLTTLVMWAEPWLISSLTSWIATWLATFPQDTVNNHANLTYCSLLQMFIAVMDSIAQDSPPIMYLPFTCLSSLWVCVKPQLHGDFYPMNPTNLHAQHHNFPSINVQSLRGTWKVILT